MAGEFWAWLGLTRPIPCKSGKSGSLVEQPGEHYQKISSEDMIPQVVSPDSFVLVVLLLPFIIAYGGKRNNICFGILASSSYVCSGNGECIDYNKCACRNNFIGPDCATPLSIEFIMRSISDPKPFYENNVDPLLGEAFPPPPPKNDTETDESSEPAKFPVELVIGISSAAVICILIVCCCFSLLCCIATILILCVLVKMLTCFRRRKAVSIDQSELLPSEQPNIVTLDISNIDFDRTTALQIRRSDLVGLENQGNSVSVLASHSDGSSNHLFEVIHVTDASDSRSSGGILPAISHGSMENIPPVSPNEPPPVSPNEVAYQRSDDNILTSGSVELISPKHQPTIVPINSYSHDLKSESFEFADETKHNFNDVMDKFISSDDSITNPNDISPTNSNNNNHHHQTIPQTIVEINPNKPNLTINIIKRPPPIRIRQPVEPTLQSQPNDDEEEEEDNIIMNMNMRSPDLTLKNKKRMFAANTKRHTPNTMDTQIRKIMGIEAMSPKTPQFFAAETNQNNWKKIDEDNDGMTITGNDLFFSRSLSLSLEEEEEEEEEKEIEEEEVRPRKKSRLGRESPTTAAMKDITTKKLRRSGPKRIREEEDDLILKTLHPHHEEDESSSSSEKKMSEQVVEKKKKKKKKEKVLGNFKMDDLECKICRKDNNVTTAFGPCGHVTCNSCQEKLEICPFCNTKIKMRLKLCYI